MPSSLRPGKIRRDAGIYGWQVKTGTRRKSGLKQRTMWFEKYLHAARSGAERE